MSNYKVTQLASSAEATDGIGLIFPDSSYIDTTILGFSSSDSNGHLPTSGLVQQELDKKVDKIGNTIITANTSDTPIFLKSTNNNSTWLGFLSNNGTELGYLGISNNNLPYFYYNSAHQLAYNSDIHNPTITIKQSGHSDQTFTLNQSANTTITLSDNDTNTTYTLATGDNNGQIKVTPSSGNAYNVSVKGLGTNAYSSTSYLPLTGGTISGNLTVQGSGGITIVAGTPFLFQGYGTGTYNQGAFVCNTTDKFGVECPRETDSSSGTIVPFRIGARGGQLGNLITGKATADQFIKSGATSSDFLRGDGSTTQLKTINNQSIVGSGNLTIGGEGILGGMSLTFNRKATSAVTVNTTNFEYGNYLIIPSGLATMLIEKNTSNNLYVSEWIQASYSLIDSTSFVIYQGGNVKYISKLNSCYIFKINFPS